MLSALSKASFGVYLVHPLVIYAWGATAGPDPLSLGPLLAVPLEVLGAAGASLAASMILGGIPVVRDWLV